MKNSKLTKRKFYNKWLYKITLTIQGINYFRYSDLSSITPRSYSYRKTDTFYLHELDAELKSVEKSQWGKRIECNNIDIYTNDRDLFLRLSKRFEDITVHRFEPVNEQQLLENGNVYVVNQYPYNRYHYKVFLSPHSLSNEEDRKMQFLAWVDTQGDRVRISDSVRNWFIRMNWNWDRRYMYVEDEQTLLMLKMRESDALGKVYKYLLADK
jgi:hypothetical protein